jgi:TRAP-type C4-dicarboxylate transport system substrate-binding protein
MQSNIAPVWAGKFYEVVKYNLRLDYTASFEEVFINKDKFDSLPKKYQDILTESANETEKWIRQYAEDNLEKYLDDLRNSGMQVHIPTPAEYAEWTASREKVWQSAASELGGRLDLKLAKEIYQSFQ